jgi:hypothetical protein
VGEPQAAGAEDVAEDLAEDLAEDVAEDVDSPEPPDEEGLDDGLGDASAGLDPPSVDEVPDAAGVRLSVR